MVSAIQVTDPWHWLDEAVKQDFVVLDVENFFWATRNQNDLPLMPCGRRFKDVQEQWEKERGGGKQANGQVKYKYHLSPELLLHVDTWENYCFAIGFQAPKLPALVWSEMHPHHVHREELAHFILHLVRRVPIVAHNSAHDIRIIKHNFGIPFEEYLRVEDSMLLHNVLYSELPHTLNFCSSVYSTMNQHKDLGTHSKVYLHGDVRATAEVWWNLNKEAERDPQSKKIYDTLQRPMLPILLESHLEGMRINKPFMQRMQHTLEEKRQWAMQVANEYVQGFSKPGGRRKKLVPADDTTGAYEAAIADGQIDPDPSRTINMNSPKQMNEWVYGHAGLKIKGLRKSKKSGLYPLGKDQIAILQDQFVPRDDKEDTFETRLEMGGHPLIEAKAEFTQADKFLSGYINPYLESDRVYPQFKLHGQATGRWSTTAPNIPGLNKALKPLYIPDVGHCWVGGDWSNAELRIMAEVSQDELLQRGFAEGWDLHSMHASQAFGWDSPKGRFEWAKQFRKVEGTWDEFKEGREFRRGNGWWGVVAPTDWKDVTIPADHDWIEWISEGGPQPGWMGDKDLFRRFTKILVFRLMYGGGVDSAAQIPGAKSLGLPEKRLVQASKDLIGAHLCWEEYWNDVGGQAKKEKIVRNHNGRARRLMSTRESNRFREGVNFPIQSWVSDLLNRTLLEVKDRAPWAVMKYTIHDSFYFQCPLDKREELAHIVKEAAELPLRGQFTIPFDMDTIAYDEREEKRVIHNWKDDQWVQDMTVKA